jgi:DNA-binding NtrC family response regulator
MIEDDHSIAQLVQLSLQARGAEIVTVLDPEALDDVLGSSLIFDLALLDLSPIKARLHEILSRLAALSPEAPLVLMSGEPAVFDEELEKYFSTSVCKPFDMDQLLETVDRCLANARAKHAVSP